MYSWNIPHLDEGVSNTPWADSDALMHRGPARATGHGARVLHLPWVPLPSDCLRTDRPEEGPTSSKLQGKAVRTGLSKGSRHSSQAGGRFPGHRRRGQCGALGLGSHTCDAKINADVRPRGTRSPLPTGERGSGGPFPPRGRGSVLRVQGTCKPRLEGVVGVCQHSCP